MSQRVLSNHGSAQSRLYLYPGNYRVNALDGRGRIVSSQPVTIAPGTTVKWVNHDDIPHLVGEKALAFKSKALDTNDSFSFTFTHMWSRPTTRRAE